MATRAALAGHQDPATTPRPPESRTNRPDRRWWRPRRASARRTQATMVSKASTAASCSLSSSTIPASRTRGSKYFCRSFWWKKEDSMSRQPGAENGVGGAPGHGGDGVVHRWNSFSRCCLFVVLRKLSGHRAGAGRTGRVRAAGDDPPSHAVVVGSASRIPRRSQWISSRVAWTSEDVGDPLEAITSGEAVMPRFPRRSRRWIGR